MDYDREYWRERLHLIEAFANGHQVEMKHGNGNWCELVLKTPKFNGDIRDYRIAKSKERVPLEAEDWIKDGPWWVRGGDIEGMCMVKTVTKSVICYDTSDGYRRSTQIPSPIHLERRNATSDWMPCWKEKE